MFGLGGWELLIIGIVAVLLFGSRLPQVARSCGQAMIELKRGAKEIELECQKMDGEGTTNAKS
jgi:sec-independent protein translocase protein TatA